MEEVFKFGQMVQDMTDFGKKEWLTVEDDWYMPTEMFTLENGSKTRLTDMEFSKTTTEVATKAIGLTINNTVTEQKHGQMVLHMLVNMPTAWNTAKENFAGLIRVLMRVFLKKTICTERASINGTMVEYLEVLMLITLWRDTEYLLGRMDVNMLEAM
jgi:flagellar biosynthesis regulator FlbT